MALADTLGDQVQKIINTPWSTRIGQEVPSSDTVALAGGAVELEAVFLYADMASSSRMVKDLDRRVAAKILKSFHSVVCTIVRTLDAAIVSFDGDRVLAVFIGDTKNSTAAKAGLQIKYAVQQVVRPKFENQYDSVKRASFTIGHGVGIDSGTVLSVRAGVRGHNDLIWIGRAPNLAAKLSDLREAPYHTFITSSVYKKLNEASKYGGNDKHDMWEARNWKFLDESVSVYRSSYHWKP